MTDTPERIDMRVAMEQNAKAATSWFAEWEKAADALAAAQARIAELEADYAICRADLLQCGRELEIADKGLDAARAEALEEAAKVASGDFDLVDKDEIFSQVYTDGQQLAGLRIAAAIRALKGKQNG